tara:strand:+ start:242 stop:793 length:552 start_codon:yes stop_codon:yes gene_type:complete
MTYICDKYKFIFIEPQKTATSSFNYMFNKQYKIKNLLNKGKISGEDNRHRTAKHIKKKFSDRWKEYVTFSIVRNPWHRYASWVKWLEKKDIYITIDTILNQPFSVTDFIFDEDKLIVDKILKFENLQQEWNEFAPTISLESKTLAHKNKANTYDYHDYYHHDLIDIVYEREKKIIDMMNYTYD